MQWRKGAHLEDKGNAVNHFSKRYQKRKAIVFKEVNFLNLAVALFFALFRFKVYCLALSELFKNDTAVALFKSLNIRLINLEECQNIDISITDADSGNLTHSVMAELFQDERVLRCFGRLFPGVWDIEKKLKSIICHMVVDNLLGLSNILCWVQDYARHGEKVYLFSPNNVFSRIILKNANCHCVNLYPVPLFYVVTFLCIVLNICGNSARLLYSKVISHSKVNNRAEQDCNTPMLKTPDISKYEVIYFPHESVAYGNLFLKDQFYCEDPDSPFHMTKILHIELSGSVTSKEWYRKMVIAFNENRVPFCFLPSIPKRHYVNYLFDFALFFYHNFFRIKRFRMSNRLFMTLLFLRSYLQFRRYMTILGRFKKARIALVGYDILFPEILSLALERLNIKTFATQERLISSFSNSFTCILDTYLTCSEISEEYMRKKPCSYVHQYKAVGFVRSDILYRCSNGCEEEFYRKIKKNKRLVLAMDYHSYPDKFTNFQQQIVNWRANKAFYKDLIRLSLRYPEIYIVLRSKNDDWCRVPDLQDVFEFMEVLPNLEVNRDFRINRGYEIASMADIVIAKHTSFADECLAAGKPVLFYDFLPNARKMISSYFDYEKYPIFVYSYEELEERIRLLLEDDFYMDKNLLENMRRRFFGDLHDGKVVKRVHEELMKLYSEQNSAVNLD